MIVSACSWGLVGAALWAARTVGAAPSSASPGLQVRAGPSGFLNFPPGGTVFKNHNSHGRLNLSYDQVSTPNAQTIGIDIYLQPTGPLARPIPLAAGLTASKLTDTIDGNFALINLCGDYELVIYEYQWIDGNNIVFKSQAPSIKVVCD